MEEDLPGALDQEMSDNTEKTGDNSLGSKGDDTTDSEKERLQMRRILVEQAVEQQQQLLSLYNHGMRNSGDNGKQHPISLCHLDT